MAYCTECGNKGIDFDGNPCSCKFRAETFYDSVSCLDIPEQYRGIIFTRALVPKDIHDGYGIALEKIYNDVVRGLFSKTNYLICSPINHSKSILAYSCIEQLFRSGVDIFPLYDVLELKRILLDLDLGRKQTYPEDNPQDMLTCPLLFAKIPRVVTWEVYDIIAMLLDRRVRRNVDTIFLYDGTWQNLTYADRNNILTGLKGDGTFNTLKVLAYDSNNESTGLPEIQLQDRG